MPWRCLPLAIALAVLLGGCLMPNRGTPVLVDSRGGEYWSGEAVLLEVSPDQKRCKIAARDQALFVRERWVSCVAVHPRTR